ncbi:MAG: ATP-binding protein [Bacteroidota bacterium]
MKYIHRKLENSLSKYLKLFPVVGLSGPRQSGKSSMLKNLLGDKYKYITFDDYRMKELFLDDPEKFMRINNSKVIFDEAHKVPEIFNYIKIAVDDDRDNYGKFIVTGSAQFLMLKNISESLAGRIGLLTLLPFEFSEIPKYVIEDSIYKGSYPENVMRKYEGSEDWYSSYISTYLEKDIRSIGEVGALRDFNRLIQLLAARTAQLLNMSELAKEIGVTVATVKRWISILETSYIVFLLPPFYENLGKRITKAPKIYFYDTGLVSFITGIEDKKQFEGGPLCGTIFENYIVSEVQKKIKHQNDKHQLYFMRTNHGVEVDLIVDKKSSRDFIEVKYSETFKPTMARAIESMMTKKDQSGYILYNGTEIQYSENIKAMNYKAYLK